MNPHRSRIFKTKAKSTEDRQLDPTRPWKHQCACGGFSEWLFWRNALKRAHRHHRWPGVYSG